MQWSQGMWHHMDTELKDLIDELGENFRTSVTATSQHQKQIADLRSRLDVLAFGTTSNDAPGARKHGPPFALPSLREFRDHERKAQGSGSDPGGGYIVVPETGAFFDRMRPANVILAADPVLVDFTSDSMNLPGLTASTTAAAVAEAGTITASDATLGNVRLTARKYVVRTVASSEWLSDANPSARQIIADDHRQQLTNKLDADMLHGNGTAILGLRRKAGVTATELGAGNGLAPTLDNVADMLYRLEAANADMTRLALFMHPRSWNVLKKLQDLQGRYQLQPDPTAPARRNLFGVPVFTSSQVTMTETVGGSTDCSYIVAADMSKVVVGRRAELGVLFDPFTLSSTDQVVIQTITRWDMNILHTAAVEVLTGVRS